LLNDVRRLFSQFRLEEALSMLKPLLEASEHETARDTQILSSSLTPWRPALSYA
jgi:hypothetical protein